MTPTIQSPPITGLSGSMRSLLSSALEYTEARWRLLKAETGQMGASIIRAAVFGSIALFAAASAYVGGIVTLTLWIARTWWQGDLLPALLIVLLINLIAVGASALIAVRSLSKKGFFRHTLEELKADKQCLLHPQP